MPVCEKKLKRYYKNIQRELVCSREAKRRILSDIAPNVVAYLSEHPETDLAAVENHFGTPRQIAASYVDSLGTQELLRKLKLRNRILLIVTVALVISVGAWLTALVIASIDAKNSARGYYEVFVTED